jgi:hypothetical protein
MPEKITWYAVVIVVAGNIALNVIPQAVFHGGRHEDGDVLSVKISMPPVLARYVIIPGVGAGMAALREGALGND